MIFLSGVTNAAIEDRLIALGIGLLVTPHMAGGGPKRIPLFPCWAADNGCFSDRWTEMPWLDWLATLPTDGCLFAVAPDVYPDAQASLDRGLQYADLIRSMGFPVAIVAQDGAENIRYPWDEFDCLFIGGAKTANPKDEWKISPQAEQVCRAARNAGKWVHMGRVNSLRRMERARSMGVQSCDGTFIKHGPEINLKRMARFLQLLAATPALPMDRWESVSHPTHKEFA